MTAPAALQAAAMSITDLRGRGWRFIEVLVPTTLACIPAAMQHLAPVRLCRWLAIPPEHHDVRAQRFDTQPEALRWAAGIEVKAGGLA